MNTKALWFHFSRIFAAAVFLLILFLFTVVHQNPLPVNTAYLVIITYIVVNVILYIVFKKDPYLFLLLLDVLFITVLIYLTGSHDSSFQFIFLIIIVFASFYIERNQLYFLSAVIVILFSLLLNLEFLQIIPSYAVNQININGISYLIGIHFIAVFFTSIVSSRLSGRISLLTGQIQIKEKKLKEITSLKNRIVDSVSSCIVTTDKNGRINYINDNAINFFEKMRLIIDLDLIGSKIIPLIPLDDLIDSAEVQVKRKEYTFENGTVIGINVTKMFSGNEFDGYLLIFQDLTDFKKLEEIVHFKGNLESLGEMASGIAHEIRNPLASMKASVQLLNESSKFENEKELFRIVEDEIDRVELIIKDFMSFASDREEKAVSQNINKILMDVLVLFERGLTDEVKLIIDENINNENNEINCQRGKIKRVFWNILKNAEKAVEYSSKKEIKVLVKRNETSLSIKIKDTGTGIKENELKRIFSPYFSSFAKGSGLGLSICKKILDEMGGSIHVESTPGEGSCFRINFPLSE